MNRITGIRPLLPLLWLALCLPSLHAQSTDFDAFPRLDAEFQHLDLTLSFEEEPDLLGELSYTLRLRREGIEELRFDAVGIGISEVVWENGETGYRIGEEELIVELPEGVSADRDYTLRIRYRAEPAFGILRSERGTIHSSGLPASVRHWLPVVDHPRNRFTADVSLIIPVDKQAVFSGVAADERPESVDYKRVRFYSDRSLPASSIRFAVGEFGQESLTAGRHRIELHSEAGLLDEESRRDLMEEAREVLQSGSGIFGSDYPSRTLSIVVLEDDRWEVKNYGAGIVFGYRNRDDLRAQIVTGILAQWAGVGLHEERWAEAEPVVLLQAWLLNEKGLELPEPKEASPFEALTARGIYEPFTERTRTAWRYWLQSEDPAAAELGRHLADAAGELAGSLPEVITWYDFAAWFYLRSGLPMMEPPVPELPGVVSDIEPPAYRVRYDLDLNAGRLHLEFEALGEPVDSEVTLLAEVISMNERRSSEILLSGAEHEVSLEVDRAIDNLLLSDPGGSVELRPEKPFSFWLHQLRYEEDPEVRAAAAFGLSRHDDNPDLQLALLDLIGNENDPLVYAEMIRTLGRITAGASGTDQLFRQRFRNDRHPAIQQAIMEALGSYEGNETVLSLLRATAQRSEFPEVRRTAVRSLSRAAGSERFLTEAQSLLGSREAVPIAAGLLGEMADAGLESETIEEADRFLGDGYPYGVRLEVLELLLQLDDSAGRWSERVERLSADNDPRVRSAVLEALPLLSVTARDRIVSDRTSREFDDRVLMRLRDAVQ